MTSPLAQIKHDARRALHDAMKVEATYVPPGGGAATALGVRWHNKINRVGDLDNQGWAEIIEGIDRIIFDREELAAKSLTLAEGGVVTLELLMGGFSFVLGAQEPDDGPIERIWIVTRGAP